jgi:hypothetical protein
MGEKAEVRKMATKSIYNTSGGGSAAKVTPTNYVVGGTHASGEIDLARKTNEEFPKYYRQGVPANKKED